MTTTANVLTINEKLTTISSNNLAAEVVIDCTEPRPDRCMELLKSADARNMAIAFASTKGINRAGINESPQVYPINHENQPIDAASPDTPANHPDRQMAGYQARIRIVGNPV
jgi:hypothetical protein